jgi:hypothetical protein
MQQLWDGIPEDPPTKLLMKMVEKALCIFLKQKISSRIE